MLRQMNAKFIGPKDSTINPDPWRGERELAKSAGDDKLLSLLASYKVGTEPRLIREREIERRKDAARDSRDSREDDRFRKTKFRSWVAVGISVVALAGAFGVALYK